MAAAADDDAVIEIDITDGVRAAVSAQFRRQLPPEYEFDEASFIEFIMLLVANRRSKAQIRREMTPFVGDDAVALVDWLFSTLNAMKPKPIAPPAVKGRLSSVVLAPKPLNAVAGQPAAAPAAQRKPPSATRLLANAAKDAVKSTAERRPAPAHESLASIADRKARFQQDAGSRPTELRTRRSLLGDAQKRTRSPRGAVMDIEAKRLRSHVPQNADAILERKLSSPKRSRSPPQATASGSRPKVDRRTSSPPVRFFRATRSPPPARDEPEQGRPAPIRRPPIDSAVLETILDRTLSSSGQRSSYDDGEAQRRRVDTRTFTVSIRNDSIEAKMNGALQPELAPEPEVVFKPGAVKPGVVVVTGETKPSAAVDAALPPPKKKPTRCAFWPNCDKGYACAFVHPSSPCKYWPSCQYGDKCLYIHDKNLANVAVPCKFGAKCARGAECKFSHPAPARTGARADGDTRRLCRYDKRCTKIACPFRHPEREKSEYFNDQLRDRDDEDDEDVTVVLSSTLPSTPPGRPF